MSPKAEGRNLTGSNSHSLPVEQTAEESKPLGEMAVAILEAQMGPVKADPAKVRPEPIGPIDTQNAKLCNASRLCISSVNQC